jgi:hypothetical protein
MNLDFLSLPLITLMRHPLVSRCILLYGIFCLSCPVHAATDSAVLHEKKLSLARNFVQKLKNKFENNTPYLPAASISEKDQALSQIADGEEVQFRPRLGKITLDYDIYAIKRPNDFYLSLTDLIDTLHLPIAFSKDDQTAQGWFLREDWRYYMDLKQGRVQSRNQDFIVSPQDYEVTDNDIFIAGKVVGSWLAMTFDYDVSQQYVDIVSEYPLPIVAQMKRRDSKGGGKIKQNVAQLPRQETEYEWAHLTTADVSLRTNYKREGDTGQSELLNRTDVALAGDLLKHDAYVFMNADDRDGLNSVTGRLSRASDKPELLGPLNARSYAVGDVTTVDVPLTGYSAQELGARVSNNPLSGINFQNTSITGNAVSGWDVELYRGNTRVDIVTVDDTGRYEFTDVQLFAGDNEFDILFYGNQGEIRRESINIPLNEATLSAQASTYDVSLSLNEKATYRRIESEDEDVGTPRLAGQYNFFLGDSLAYVGGQAVEVNGEQKFFAGTGLTTIQNGFVLDANLAADEDANAGARFGARKNIYDWNLALSTELATDEFTADSVAVPQTFGVFGSAQKTYTPPFGLSGNLFLNGNYREYADGTTANTASIGVGQGFSNLSLSNTLSYDETVPAAGLKSERFVNSLSARARLNSKMTLRTGIDYRIKPESRMERYIASLNYRPTSNLTIDVEAEHRPEDKFSEGEVRANYIHNKFRLSPFVRYDSDNDLTTGVNLTTDFVNLPHDNMPLITSDRLTAQGFVSAKVYLDANGNFIFDEGDEPLPDAIVESLNSRQREETAENGYALLRKLSTNLPTDIRVDDESLPDPFMVSVNRGNSVLPRAGKIYEMEFPIQFAGEVDGTVAFSQETGDTQLAKFVSVSLIPVDPIRNETITAKAAQDGFYLLSEVPPGQYFLTIDPLDAKIFKAARPMPQLMTFTHEGTTFYAQDLVMKQGIHDIDFEMLSVGYFPDINPQEPEYYISVDTQDKSGPLQALYRMRMKDVVGQVVSGLQPIDKEGDATYYRIGPNGLEAAYQRCEIMSVHKLPCKVSVLPVGSAPTVSETDKAKATKQAAL